MTHGATVDPVLVCQWLSLPLEGLLRTCKQSRYQGSGPGGQKRNRVYSGVRLTHEPSGLSIEAEARRESLGNLDDALHKLRIQLALSITQFKGGDVKNDSTLPLEIENSSVFTSPAFRTKVSESHFDFPKFVFRAVYFLIKYEGQISGAAESLGCTASALTRFLKIDKGVWATAKGIRERYGLHALK